MNNTLLSYEIQLFESLLTYFKDLQEYLIDLTNKKKKK